MVLTKINFDSKFINIVKALFSFQQAYITDSGLLLETFRVEREVLQENLLSPLLYTLAIEPLLRHIHKRIKGIELDFLEIIKNYEAASNAKINRDKTVLVLLSLKAQEHRLQGMIILRKW
ncbi:6067_t:CDS:2 [Gigaspora rosea]|nr:6067_t:CDS:2 [Gigaspora rosea]